MIAKAALLALSGLAAAGCSAASAGSSPSDAGESPGMLDDPAIEQLAAGYAMQTKVTARSFPSRGHQGNPLVDVYANAIAQPTYGTLRSTVTAAAGFALPVGSLLVKVMHDAHGGPPVLTAMYKKAPGYDSAHDDWWYGRLAGDGTPTNPAYAGRVSFCIACHQGAASSDYAWGVPLADQ